MPNINAASSIFVGSSRVARVYVGSSLGWADGPNAPPQGVLLNATNSVFDGGQFDPTPTIGTIGTITCYPGRLYRADVKVWMPDSNTQLSFNYFRVNTTNAQRMFPQATSEAAATTVSINFYVGHAGSFDVNNSVQATFSESGANAYAARVNMRATVTDLGVASPSGASIP